jgi:hypothetical protein
MTKASDLAIEGELMEAWMKKYGQRQKRSTKRMLKQCKQKSGFKVEWVRLPIRWWKQLRGAGVGSATYDLAIVILIESFRLDQMAVKEIVLSRITTGQLRRVRQRAIGNLVRLGLIRVRRAKGKAVRVSQLYYL